MIINQHEKNVYYALISCLAFPFTREEWDDFFVPTQELIAVAPYAIWRVRQYNACRIACVPECLCGFDFGWRQRYIEDHKTSDPIIV